MFAGRRSPHLALNKTSLRQPQPQPTPALLMAPSNDTHETSPPTSLDICPMPLSMPHHCIYFLVGVNGICYSMCARWLPVPISHGGRGGGDQCLPGGARRLGYADPRSAYRQYMCRQYIPIPALSGDAGITIPECVEPLPSTQHPGLWALTHVATVALRLGAVAQAAGTFLLGWRTDGSWFSLLRMDIPQP